MPVKEGGREGRERREEGKKGLSEQAVWFVYARRSGIRARARAWGFCERLVGNVPVSMSKMVPPHLDKIPSKFGVCPMAVFDLKRINRQPHFLHPSTISLSSLVPMKKTHPNV